MRMLGRYEHNSDPRLAMLLHEVTEQGWATTASATSTRTDFTPAC
jgi:hypothetical protein